MSNAVCLLDTGMPAPRHGMWILTVVSLSTSFNAYAVELKKETTDAFDRYVADLETRLERRWQGDGFLWSDGRPQKDELQRGALIIEPAHGNGTVEIKDGLIQDWVGAIFIPSTTLAGVLAVVQDYARHGEIYKPEVASALIRSHSGNDFAVYMRINKSKMFLTDVLNTEHLIHYTSLDAKRTYSRAYSTRIAEVHDPGKPSERELPVGKDRGLLWRLYGYWFFEERGNGVIVECESVTLTRDVPFGMGHLLSPIVHGLPSESLRKGLESTRRAVISRAGL